MMFEKRFTTRTIAETVNLDIQLSLWGMIDQWKEDGIRLDYLQVFDLSIITVFGKRLQKIIHKQEQPQLTRMIVCRMSKPVTEKIFIIDDGENAVMMFASEY